MAAKSKKRLIKIENKLLKLEKLELKDVICSICQSILVEPVTLPCYHCFCLSCFNGSIENNALCCPLCRLRIGSWLRTATKQNNTVNTELWNYVQSKFSREIATKLKGEDINLTPEKPTLRLSAPGEIRSEYEAELRRLKAERLDIEQKQLQETELLIKKIEQEESEIQRRFTERLKQDEILARQIQEEHFKSSTPLKTRVQHQKKSVTKHRLKATRIDGYLTKIQTPLVLDSPIITDDNTSTDGSSPKAVTDTQNANASPEMVPNCGKIIKSIVDKKNKGDTSFWNKENGKNKIPEQQPSLKEKDNTEDKNKIKANGDIKTLPVSLPLPNTGILQHKINVCDNRKETGSVDSMRQELCYFKPIEKIIPTSFNTHKGLPVRVPCRRVAFQPSPPQYEAAPSRAQYLESLSRLRDRSIAKNLSSAFVIAISTPKDTTGKCEPNTRVKIKRTVPCIKPTLSVKRNAASKNNKQNTRVDDITIDTAPTLRRTRSMGSLSKAENETTPKKAKIQGRKATSDRKPHLRSDSKKSNAKKRLSSPPSISNNINKVNLAVKNLSSPFKNCDVKKILQEQLRIEKIIEQEKSDWEMARKMDAEWNGRRQPRRTAVKRQVPLNYARSAKKLKI